MSRNNRTLIALTLALLIALGASAIAAADLIEPDQIMADEVNYKTCTAEYGHLTREISVSATDYFPLTQAVFYRGDEAAYVRMIAKRNQAVKAGDPLFEVEVRYDAVRLAELELEEQRAREALISGEADLQAQIDAQAAANAVERDDYARRVGDVRLRRLQAQLDQFRYQQQYTIDGYRRSIDALNERRQNAIVTAPMDGVMTDPVYLREGDKVTDGMKLCTIASESVLLAAVKDSRLRYGMAVTVEAGPNKDRISVTGHIVAAGNATSGVTAEYALVALDDMDALLALKSRNMRLHANLIDLDNVLLIERKASVLTSGKYVVTLLTDDGVTHKRFITQGLIGGDSLWVLQGLSAGDVVIID